MNNAFPGCDSFEQRKTQLVSSLNSFLGPPFTLQRLCELLVEEKPYTNTTKYMNALEKMFAVSGTMPTLSPAEYNRAIEQQHAAFQAALSIPTPGQPQNSFSGINEEQFQIAAVMPDTNATSTETTDATAESPSPSSSSSLSASSSSSSDSSSLHSNASISPTTTSDEVGEPEPMDL
ncbi:protein phosphatase 4, regulatory subunit 2, variant 2 [Balamuthia mandrillaris]